MLSKERVAIVKVTEQRIDDVLMQFVALEAYRRWLPKLGLRFAPDL